MTSLPWVWAGAGRAGAGSSERVLKVQQEPWLEIEITTPASSALSGGQPLRCVLGAAPPPQICNVFLYLTCSMMFV